MLGISYDSVKSHLAFAKKHNLSFTLLSDSTKEVSELYGAKGLLGLMPNRYTYLIDEEGKIVAVMTKVNVSDHADEIIAAFNK